MICMLMWDTIFLYYNRDAFDNAHQKLRFFTIFLGKKDNIFLQI